MFDRLRPPVPYSCAQSVLQASCLQSAAACTLRLYDQGQDFSGRTSSSMRIKLALLVIFFLVSMHSAFAAGGACPSSTKYLNVTNPAGPLVTLSSLGITNCFYIAANGSDSNSGTSETMPWQHAPGMSTCTGNCAANTPTGGAGYIFRGGDTWHEGNNSLSPYTNGWIWTHSGTSQSVPIYIGVDPTWYSGSSWTRPILNGDNPTNDCHLAGPCPVAACPYPNIGGGGTSFMFRSPGNAWVVFDDFEFTGMCWGSGGGLMLSWYSNNAGTLQPYFFVPERNYFHGWTYSTAQGANQTLGKALAGNASYPGAVIQFNVIDGSDSDSYALSPFGSDNTDIYILRYNITRYDGGDVVSNDCHYIHDNIFELFSLTGDGTSHGDIPFCEAGGTDVGTPNLWFNNVWRSIGIPHNGNISYLPSIAIPSGRTAYVFNNVWHDNQPGAGGNYVSDEGNAGSKVFFNNTAERMLSSSNQIVESVGSTITSVNNHWISTNASQADIWSSSPASETAAKYMTNANATAQGYVTANDFAPTASNNITVGAGANQTNGYCADSVLHYAIADAECLQGITGVAYDSTNHAVIYPGRTAVARPSVGSWDVGAYQFSTNVSTIQHPTNLAVTVQ
jgi:hypothetical protein